MNLQLNPTQNNTGSVAPILKAGEDLTGKEGYLCVITNASGKPVATLPAADTDAAVFMVASGDAAGKEVVIERLPFEGNYRAKAKGTGNPGDLLVLAAAGGGVDKGKLRKLPTTTGSYTIRAVAEEAFVDGQFVAVTRLPERVVAVA